MLEAKVSIFPPPTYELADGIRSYLVKQREHVEVRSIENNRPKKLELKLREIELYLDYLDILETRARRRSRWEL